MHWVAEDGTVLWANRAELEMLGYEPNEFIGKHIAQFHADADVIADILGRLSRGETLREFQARLRCKDGSVRHVLINSNVYREDGRFLHTRCFTRDITGLLRVALATAS
jgi:PAS domain S-box-containing protein